MLSEMLGAAPSMAAVLPAIHTLRRRDNQVPRFSKTCLHTPGHRNYLMSEREMKHVQKRQRFRGMLISDQR